MTMCTSDSEGKKSDVLCLTFVHDADTDDTEPELLKDKL